MSSGTEQIFLPDSVANDLRLQFDMMTRPGNGAPTINTINLDNVEDFTKVCRVCATVTDLVMPIFTNEGLRINLADKIKRYLPIRVKANDVLPLVVCYQCTSTLLAAHELALCSLQADAALRTAREQQQERAQRRLQPQPAGDPSEGIVGDNPNEEEYTAVVKKVLFNYFHTLNVDDGDDYRLVCQQCSWQGYTTEKLAEHLQAHRIKVPSVEGFIRQHLTFEQTLDSDDDHDKPTPPPNTKAPSLSAHCCPFCDTIFSNTARLALHLAEHVEISEKSAVMCCGGIYTDRRSFIQHAQDKHARAPPPGHVCRACGHQTDSPASLADHINNIHPDNVLMRQRGTKRKPKDLKYIPTPCPDCGKKFSNKYNMAVHLRSHRGKTVKIKCEFCNRSYGSRGAVVNHVKLAHTGLLRFACEVCGERFPNRTAKGAHLAIHTGERPHVCTFEGCSGAFRARNTLLRHLETHSNERSYSCHCGKAFRRSTHLKRHLQTHQKTS